MDRILLLEGDAAARAAIVQALGAERRLEICAVGTPKEAWAVFERQPFDMVIAELTIADGPAFEMLKRMRNGQNAVPVVVITGHFDELVKQHSELGSWDVLRRPFDEAQLLARVRQKVADKKLSSPPDSAFTVSDYLQLAGMARRSVIIHVEHANVEGQIVVQNGAPVWARDREGIGNGAFQRLALLPRADINCQPCTTWSTKPNLEGSLEALLLEAARHSDEVARSNKSRVAPPVVPQSSQNGSAAPPLPPARAIPRPNLPPPRRERPESPPPSLELSKPPSVRQPSPEPRVTDPFAEEASADAAAPTSVPKSNTTPTSTSQKENNMRSDSSRPPDSKRILTGVPAISAIACADQEGSVLDYAGSFDAETACAVATIASRPITEIVGELGLGDLQSWCVSMGDNTWYVVHQSRQLFVAQGSLNKNPSTVLRKVEAGCRGQQ